MPDHTNDSLHDQGLRLIQQGRALVKTVCSPIKDNQSWDLLIPQLDSARLPNYTRLTATSLLPKDGRMRLFKPATFFYNLMVGLLFDPQFCKISYVFEQNVESKKWLDVPEKSIPEQISLRQLQDKLAIAQQENRILNNNEVIAALSLEALIGVFATENTLFGRLNALNKQRLLFRHVNKTLPIYIISPEAGVMVYDTKAQAADIQHAYSRALDDPLRILVEELDMELSQKLLQMDIAPKQSLVAETKALCFLVDESAPKVLNHLVLDYLGVTELADHVYKKPILATAQGLQQIMQEQLEARKIQDLQELEKILGRAIDNETLPALLSEERFASNLLERAVFHFSWLHPQKAEEQFFSYLKSLPIKNPLLVAAFLRYIPKFKIRNLEELMISHDFEGDEYSYIPWSPLLAAVFSSKDAHAQTLVNYQDKEIPFILSDMDSLEKTHDGFFGPYDKPGSLVNDLPDSMKDLRTHKYNLLIALQENQSHLHRFNYAEKRLVEERLLNELSKLNTKEFLQNFYLQHKDSLAWNQHRHPIWDKIFHKPLTGCKQRVLKALKTKLEEMETAEEDFALPGHECALFTAEKSEVQSQLLLEKERIQKERGLCFTFFRATRDRALKVIEENLERLEKISHPIELSLLKEKLVEGFSCRI